MSRILIFAEAVTLAHVARPIALSRILRELGHEVAIAAAPAAERWLEREEVARRRIESIDPAAFLRALARGVPAYGVDTLKQYVDDDLRAIAAFGPDIVIGDFRLSLYISARLAGKPYGAIANAYWSRRYWPGVDAPPVAPLSWLPKTIADPLFRGVRPLAFAVHALPFQRACKAFGVPSPGLDLRDVYTASDFTAFSDAEAIYEPRGETGTGSAFIGPLAWEPPGVEPIPPIPDGPPIVFVAMGSSGSEAMTTMALDAVARLPVRCIVATGTNRRKLPLPSNCVHGAGWISYREACALASVAICNGGAPATYAAWAQGCRIVAVPGNLDQVLNLRAFARARARGLPVECVTASPRSIADAVAGACRPVTGQGIDVARELAGGSPTPGFDDRARIHDWIRELGGRGTFAPGCVKRVVGHRH